MADLTAIRIEVVRQWLRVERGAFLDKVLPELRRLSSGGDLAEFWLRGLYDHRLELLWAARQVYPRFEGFPPRLQGLLLLSIFQLRYTDQAPPLIVNEAVTTARRMKLNRLTGATNAGLRKPQLLAQPQVEDFPTRREYLETITSLPGWIIDILQRDYPETDPLQMATGYSRSRQSWVRRIRQRLSEKALLEECATTGIELRPAPWHELYYKPIKTAPAQIPALQRGDLVVHDVSASAAVELLAPAAGSRVLDGCAAPGGKMRQLLELQPDLQLTAVEKDAGRLRALQRLVPPAVGVRLIQSDLLQLDEEQFEYILLDVPCTGSGNYGKKPDSRYHRGAEELEQLLKLQQALLRRAAELLEPGGKLVYSTCSVFKDENERQIEAFLQERPDFSPVETLPEKLPQVAPGAVKFTPWEHGTGGAYATALMRSPR